MTLQSESQFSALAATVRALRQARSVLESGHSAPLKTGALSAAVRESHAESLVAAAGGTASHLRRALQTLEEAAGSGASVPEVTGLPQLPHTARVHEPHAFAPLSEQLRLLSSSPPPPPPPPPQTAAAPTARPVSAPAPHLPLGAKRHSVGTRFIIAHPKSAAPVHKFVGGHGLFLKGNAAGIVVPPPLPPRPVVSPVKIRKAAAE